MKNSFIFGLNYVFWVAGISSLQQENDYVLDPRSYMPCPCFVQ